MITRWDKWFADDNLAQDERILAAPSSQSAENAARVFLDSQKHLILDLACGIGRDTFHLASHSLNVIGADASCNGLRVTRHDCINSDVMKCARVSRHDEVGLSGPTSFLHTCCQARRTVRWLFP